MEARQGQQGILSFRGKDCGTLHAVPCSPCIRVSCYPVYARFGISGTSLIVSGAALTQQPARYCVSSLKPHQVQIEGGWEVPFEVEGLPWQLVYFWETSVRLHGRKVPRINERLLQNSAAVAAGWKQSSVGFRCHKWENLFVLYWVRNGTTWVLVAKPLS